jgi:hypothetical protein
MQESQCNNVGRIPFRTPTKKNYDMESLTARNNSSYATVFSKIDRNPKTPMETYEHVGRPRPDHWQTI